MPILNLKKNVKGKVFVQMDGMEIAAYDEISAYLTEEDGQDQIIIIFQDKNNPANQVKIYLEKEN